MGERRELNPRMVDSQSTALIHLATSAPFAPSLYFYLFLIFISYSNFFRILKMKFSILFYLEFRFDHVLFLFLRYKDSK